MDGGNLSLLKMTGNALLLGKLKVKISFENFLLNHSVQRVIGKYMYM